jgi:hypothetical protein
VVKQAQAVARRVPIREGLAVKLGLPEAALVPGDDAELGAERLHLGREHLAVHQEAVGEHHWRPVAAAVLVAEPLTVDIGKGHLEPSLLVCCAARLYLRHRRFCTKSSHRPPVSVRGLHGGGSIIGDMEKSARQPLAVRR